MPNYASMDGARNEQWLGAQSYLMCVGGWYKIPRVPFLISCAAKTPLPWTPSRNSTLTNHTILVTVLLYYPGVGEAEFLKMNMYNCRARRPSSRRVYSLQLYVHFKGSDFTLLIRLNFNFDSGMINIFIYFIMIFFINYQKLLHWLVKET